MESKKEVVHTPEPWFYQEDSDEYTHIIRSESNPRMIVVHLRQDSTGKVEADARRIVACVNYCAGLETGDMINATESGNGAAESINALIAQRDELLAALNNLVDIIDKAGLGNLSKGVQLGAMSWYVKASDAVEWAREAIAKCEVKS